MAVCVDKNLKVVSGALDIQAWVGRRLVLNSTTAASNDTTFTAEIQLPGTVHLDVTANYTNPETVPLLIRVDVMRGYRSIRTSQPNLIFFRDRTTVAVGPVMTVAADEPAISEVLDSEMGGGMDRHTDPDLTPSVGTLRRDQPIMTYCPGDFLVPPGERIQVRYRCSHYSAAPWSSAANNNSPQYEARARSVTIQLWAGPVPDLASV
jgi:hypothetical protein